MASPTPRAEQLCVLECGRLDSPVAGAFEDLAGRPLDPVAEQRRFRKDVEGPLRGLVLGGHRAASLHIGAAAPIAAEAR